MNIAHNIYLNRRKNYYWCNIRVILKQFIHSLSFQMENIRVLTGLLRDFQHGLKKETNYNRISMTQIVPLRIRKTIISVGKQDIHIILPKRLPTILHWCKNLMKMPLLCYLLTGTRLLIFLNFIEACLHWKMPESDLLYP